MPAEDTTYRFARENHGRWPCRKSCSANTPAAPCCNSMRRALENFRLPYITITPTFSICPKHGYLEGEHEFCPRCDEELLARKQAST